MRTALFTNFSDEPITVYWDGKPKTFKAGQSIYMPDYLAQHFAKHLVNRELLSLKADGTPKYKDGEKMTSPKKPADVPLYMDLFNKAYTAEDEDTMSQEGDSIDTAIEVANKNRDAAPGAPSAQEPQIIVPPEGDDDEDGDESSFGGAPASDAPSAPVVSL